VSLLVTGWVALDDIETPFATRSEILGGSAPAAAIAAALFTDVRLLAAVGEDFPDSYREQFAPFAIDLAGLLTIPGGKTSRWRGRYHYDMNTRDTVETILGVNADWAPELPAGWESTRSAFFAAGDPVEQQRMLQRMPGLRTAMVDTIKFYIDTAREEFQKAMAAADFVSVNESEARELAQTPSIARAGRALLAGGAKGVIIKLGEFGAAFVSATDYFVAPGYPLEDVVDPTGAGDAFAGGFMGYLARTGDLSEPNLKRAVVYGSAMGSFAVERFSIQRFHELSREEIRERVKEFYRLVSFEEDMLS
jgi:sugar/nucleoside kinase (ribokinase family)